MCTACNQYKSDHLLSSDLTNGYKSKSDKEWQSDRKGAAAPAKQQRQRRSAPCTVSPHTEACFVVGCSPSFSSLVSSVGVGTGAKNAQIVWFQIRGQHCNFIPHICHGHKDGVRGEKNLSCGEISNFCTWNMWRKLKFLHKWINFKFLHMTDVEKSEISFVVCTIYGILLHFTLFCCKICFFGDFRCFVA